jgi:thiamine biosynthesis lipoprotein
MTTQSTTFEAIGTTWSIQIDELIEDKVWTGLFVRLQRRIASFDKAYSRFRSDSLVTRISKKAGSYPLPDDGFKLLQFYEQLYKATDGKVTPLIGQTMAEAGYDATYSLQPKELHHPPKWEDVLSYDKDKLTVTEPVLLDFGAAGKGYLVDIVSELIEGQGIRDYLVNAGGDMRYRSSERHEISVGMENPFDTSEAVGVIALANQSLCASAGSKRTWEGYNHIIDPTILQSPEQVVATWVAAEDTMTADGLATALCMQPAQTLDQFSFSYALLRQDMSIVRSKDFPVTLFEAQA